MAKRIGNTTAGQLISNLTSRLKEYTSQTITTELWLQIINTKVNMINELLSTKDKAVYKDRALLVTSPQDELQMGGLIYISDPVLHIVDLDIRDHNENVHADTDLAGGTIEYWADDGQLHTVTVISGVVNSEITGALGVHIEPYYVLTGSERFTYIKTLIHSDTMDIIDISNEPYYPYIDQIVSIVDEGISDECVDAKTMSNFIGMMKMQLSYNYKDSIIWVRDGELLYFRRGANVPSYGRRSMYFIRKPYEVKETSDIVDIPASNMDLITKLCLLDGLQTINVPIPNELSNANTQIAAMQAAKDKELAALLNNQPG